MNLRIGIVEADSAFRKKLEDFLKKRKVEVIMSVDSFQELAIQTTAEERIDMLLVHLSEATAPHFFKYKRLFPEAHLVAHAAESEHQWVEKAITGGADAYVMKNGSFRNLQRALESVAMGQAWIAPEATRLLIERIRKQEVQEAGSKSEGINRIVEDMELRHQLKAREVQVLRGLAGAKSYEEIAVDHQISINTVRHYVKTLYRKLGVHSRSELQRMVYQGRVG